VLTLHAAAQLLASDAPRPALLARIAAALGFPDPPEPLDLDTRAALGIPATFAEARIATGQGALRALLLVARDGTALREPIGRLATRLARHAPHQLWLTIAASRTGGEVALAAWTPSAERPRVAALVVDRRRVMDSDAETLAALAAAPAQMDLLTHARWLDVLGRESLTRRFYRALERVVAALAETPSPTLVPAAARQEIALLHVSRLVFLSFLEAKGWLDGDRAFLSRTFAQCMGERGQYHHRVLLPLFFGTLNTPPRRRAPRARSLGRIPFLNGGLFAPAAAERAHRGLRFDDALLGRLFGELLDRYRFTAHEETATWSEAAVDPEMLGRAFESLMAGGERRAGGVYYTPQPIVERVTGEALGEALADVLPADALRQVLAGETPDARDARMLLGRIDHLRVLDPACGSGAFLVHVLERLADLRRQAGDGRPLAELRRAVLTTSIFGVDINPTAVWLCELRLWLSTVIEGTETDPHQVTPLPNLDRHIRVGDALAGGAFDLPANVGGGAKRIELLRARYARAVGRRKATLARALAREERSGVVAELDRRIARTAAERRDLLAALRSRDLFGERSTSSRAQREQLGALRTRAREARAARRRVLAGGALPFSFHAHFPDIAARGGFDLVIGNPPWVRLHRIAPGMRERLQRDFAVFRDAAWRPGAEQARAGAGFAAQIDLASLFIERSLALACDGGIVALLVPAKLWRSLAGGGVRRLVLTAHRAIALEDWSDASPMFAAAVYPSLLVARAGLPHDTPIGAPSAVRVRLHRRGDSIATAIGADRLAFDATPGSPWLVVPPIVRTAFDRVAAAGPPLAASHFGAPLLGVKSGCNDAFLATLVSRVGDETRIERDGRTTTLPAHLVRPALRGESVAPWQLRASSDCIVWTHDTTGTPLDTLPKAVAEWLAPWRRRLLARADARRAGRWWTLFRTASASSERARVVWADVARTPRATVLPSGDPTVPLNSCYVLPCTDPADADAIAALLNSSLVAAWLALLAEPARGAYRRFLGWTMAQLPLPDDWPRARDLLAPLAAAARKGAPPTTLELLDATLRAYRIRLATVEPLLSWPTR
jgi:Eco57I restriction-modification methylase